MKRRKTDMAFLPRDVRRLLKAGGITRITHYAGRSLRPEKTPEQE